jgi:hypothetical protein
MSRNAIINEIRAVRHRISAECGHDTKRFAEHCKKLDEELRKSGKYKFVTGFFSTEQEPANSGQKK